MSFALLVIGLGKSGVAAAAHICARIPDDQITPIGVGLDLPGAGIKGADQPLFGKTVIPLDDDNYGLLNIGNTTTHETVLQRLGEHPPAYVRSWLSPQNSQIKPPSRAVERLAWSLNWSAGENSTFYHLWRRQMLTARQDQMALGQQGRALPICIVADLGEAVGSSLIPDVVFVTRAIAAQLGINLHIRGYTILPYEADENVTPTSSDEKMRAFTALRELEQFMLAVDPIFGYPFQYRDTVPDRADSPWSGALRQALFDQWYCFDRALGNPRLNGVEAVVAAISALRSEAARAEDAARTINLSESAPMRQRIGSQTISTIGTAALALPVQHLRERLTARVMAHFVELFIPMGAPQNAEWEQEVRKYVERLRSHYPLSGRLRWLFDLSNAKPATDTLDYIELLLLTPTLLEQLRLASAGKLRLPDSPQQPHQAPTPDPHRRALSPSDIFAERLQIMNWVVSFAASPQSQSLLDVRGERAGKRRLLIEQMWGAIQELHQRGFRDHLLDTLQMVLTRAFDSPEAPVASGFPAALRLCDLVADAITQAESALQGFRKTMKSPMDALETYLQADHILRATLEEAPPKFLARVRYGNRVKTLYTDVWDAGQAYVHAETLHVIVGIYSRLLAGARGLVERLKDELGGWSKTLTDAQNRLRRVQGIGLIHSEFKDEILPFHEPLTNLEAHWVQQLFERGVAKTNGLAGMGARLRWEWQARGLGAMDDYACVLYADTEGLGDIPLIAIAGSIEPFWTFSGLVFEDLTIAAELLTFLEQTATIGTWSEMLRVADQPPLALRPKPSSQMRTTHRLYVPQISRSEQQNTLDQMRPILRPSARNGGQNAELPQFPHADRQRIIYTNTTDLIHLSEEVTAYRDLQTFFVRHASDAEGYQAFALDQWAARFETRYGFPPAREVVATYSHPEHLLRFWLAYSINLIQVREGEDPNTYVYVFEPEDKSTWVLSPPTADPELTVLDAIKAFCVEITPQSEFGRGGYEGDSTLMRLTRRPVYEFDHVKTSAKFSSHTTVYLTGTLNAHENLLLRFVDSAFVKAVQKENTLRAGDAFLSGHNPQTILFKATNLAQSWRERADRPITPSPIGTQLRAAAGEILQLAGALNELDQRGQAAADASKDRNRDLYWSGALVLEEHLKQRQRDIGQTLAYLPGATSS